MKTTRKAGNIMLIVLLLAMTNIAQTAAAGSNAALGSRVPRPTIFFGFATEGSCASSISNQGIVRGLVEHAGAQHSLCFVDLPCSHLDADQNMKRLEALRGGGSRNKDERVKRQIQTEPTQSDRVNEPEFDKEVITARKDAIKSVVSQELGSFSRPVQRGESVKGQNASKRSKGLLSKQSSAAGAGPQLHDHKPESCDDPSRKIRGKKKRKRPVKATASPTLDSSQSVSSQKRSAERSEISTKVVHDKDFPTSSPQVVSSDNTTVNSRFGPNSFKNFLSRKLQGFDSNERRSIEAFVDKTGYNFRTDRNTLKNAPESHSVAKWGAQRLNDHQGRTFRKHKLKLKRKSTVGKIDLSYKSPNRITFSYDQ